MSIKTKRIIIGCKKGFTGVQSLVGKSKFDASFVQMINKLNVCVYNVSEDQVPSFISHFSTNPNVRYVEEDQIRKINKRSAIVPNDSLFPKQWGILKVKGQRAWNRAVISPPSVRIAILDSGIDQNHKDLSAGIIVNKNFTNSPNVDDLYGHGTHVAGIAAAITNNRIGVAGMSFNSAKLLNVKVLNDKGVSFDSWISRGIKFATDHGAKIINLSIGGPGSTQTLQEAISYAKKKGVVVVASVGNNNSKIPDYPGGYKYVISVAATDKKDKKASFSNFGASWVDVAAPGVNILSTCPNHNNNIGCIGYGPLSGTSMSAPFVSGLAALILATNPTLTSGHVIRRIQKTAVKIPGTGVLYRFGRIDALRAIRHAGRL